MSHIFKMVAFGLTIICIGIFDVSCMNPFAPKLVEGQASILSDQKTISGIFENFSYSYKFKDTLVYGKLLSDDFTFTYTNYEKGGISVSWGREEDMLSTSGLFTAAQSMDLIWNQSSALYGDSNSVNVTAGLSLNILFDPTYSESFHGWAVFHLVRQGPGEVWKIASWTDLSTN
jgi:hypothetical protein